MIEYKDTGFLSVTSIHLEYLARYVYLHKVLSGESKDYFKNYNGYTRRIKSNEIGEKTNLTNKKEKFTGYHHSNQLSKTTNPVLSSRTAAVNKCIHLESQDVAQNNFAKKAKAISKKPLPEQQQDFLTWLKESDAEIECEPKWSYELESEPPLSLLAQKAIAVVQAGGIIL